MKLNKAQLGKVLESVTNDVAEMLKSEEDNGERLSKTDPGEESPAEKTPEGSSTDTPDEGSAPPPAEGSAPPPAEGSAPPEGSAPAADPAAGGDPAADAGATPEALQAEYAKLPPEQLKVHFLACKAALMAVLGAGGDPAAAGGDPSMGGAPPPPPAAGPEGSASPDGSAPPPPGPGMGKGEWDDKSGKVTAGKMSKSQNDIEVRLSKAEKALDQVTALNKTVAEKDAQIAALNDNINRIAAGVTKLMDKQASMRKSYSSVGVILKPGSEPLAKNESLDVSTLSDSQVNEKLREVTASQSLAKSDRDLINTFYAGNRKDRSKVAKFFTVA